MVSGGQLRDSALHIQVSIVPQTPHPSRLTHTIEQSFAIQLYYTVGPCWLSISCSSVYTVSQPVSSVAQSYLPLCASMDCSMLACCPCPSPTSRAYSNSCPSIKSVMPCNQLILCCPLLLLPSIFPSVRVFFSESVLHIRWAKYWSFSFSISPSSEYSGLISFRIDWLDLLATNQCVIPNYPFPNLPFPTPATISLFSTSVSLFLFCK